MHVDFALGSETLTRRDRLGPTNQAVMIDAENRAIDPCVPTWSYHVFEVTTG